MNLHNLLNDSVVCTIWAWFKYTDWSDISSYLLIHASSAVRANESSQY